MPPPNEHQILTSYLLHPSPLPTILPYAAFQSLLPSSTSRTHTDLKPFYRNLQSQRDITLDDIRRRIQDECRRSTSLTTRLARQIRREEQSKPVSRKRKRSATTRDDDHDETDHESADARKSGDDMDTDTETNNQAEVEVSLDTRLHGAHGSTVPSSTPRQNHDTRSLLDAMKTANSDLQDEISSLEAQIAAIQAQCEERLGNLSDLRYGRFAQSRGSGLSVDSQEGTMSLQGIEKDVVDALADFRARLQAA